jgi:predicted RNase H-like nuclease (RuvC/YqgF family)
MNANELADMAENACCAYQKEIAAMLRQQQAEIEAAMELIKKFQEEREALKLKIDEMAGEIMSLENRIGTMTGYGHN